MLLGYEKYSSSMVLQIEHWLKNSNRFKGVYTAIVHDMDNGGVALRKYFDDEGAAFADPAGIQVVSVLPVGTTLSTIYKMHNTASRRLPNLLEAHGRPELFSRNYCIILVNEVLHNASGNLDAVTRRYWEGLELENQKVTIQREKSIFDTDKKNGDGENGGSEKEKVVRVNYYIAADSKWLEPESCALCGRRGEDIVPLIDVKHADTMPTVIFPLREKHRGGFQKMVSDKKENGKRQKALFHHIYYSHICDGNNHFQFHIQYRDVFVENREDIERSLRAFHVDASAFHVVVSPLQVENSAFAKAVIDNTFKGNARFLHFDISDTYREEARAKFSYITREYKQRKKSDRNARFCVHFVDSSIVTGKTIERARLLMRMLLEQSGLAYDDVKLFDKVFVMVNRCSYDSCNHFVREPEKDMYAYIHLAIPSYNTENDSCPACGVAERYALLAKRSTTEYLSEEFFRLTEKHQKRSYAEYSAWLENAILNKPSYFSWLRQWLYINVPASEEAEKMLCYTAEAMAEQYKNDNAMNCSEREDVEAARELLHLIDRYFEKTNALPGGGTIWPSAEGGKGKTASEREREQGQYLKDISKTTLAEILEFNSKQPQSERVCEVKKKTLRLVHRHMVAVRDFMRLSAMSRAYERLDKLFAETNNAGAEVYRRAVIEMMAETIRENTKSQDTAKGVSKEEKARFCFACAIEWIIAYVKVLSREQLANYYVYRQAIAGIITDLVDILKAEKSLALKKASELRGEDKNWGVIVDAVLKVFGSRAVPGADQLLAMYRYELYIILLHRMANLQIWSQLATDGVEQLFRVYGVIWKQYFSNRASKAGAEHIPYLQIPTPEGFLLRYLKALKTVVMSSNNATTCLRLTRVPHELLNGHRGQCGEEFASSAFLLCTRYIYLENTGLLYTGLRHIQELIPAEKWRELEDRRPADDFEGYIGKLNEEVEEHIRASYSTLAGEGKEEDIRYQNMLGNFCRFWHRGTGHSPIWDGDKMARQVTYMLQYFRQLDELSLGKNTADDSDDLPYRYEELCRTICGFTHSKMCYIAFCAEGNSPEIFTQSGYHEALLKEGRILDSAAVEMLVRRARCVWDDMRLEPHVNEEKQQDKMLVSGVAYLRDLAKKTKDGSEKEAEEYLVISIPRSYGEGQQARFYVILQDLEQVTDLKEENLTWELLRRARDILFMRRKLQQALLGDYTKLISFRFDCSYVRPFRNTLPSHPSLLHISDLHIDSDTTELTDSMSEHPDEQRKPEKMEIDLLVITGDIVDGRKSSAPEMEENYRYAEKLLKGIATRLWRDESGYLPHDWKRRIIITTGNHDYASMNQYQAVLKHRAIASAQPVETEGGTISKFAYFIDFMIRFLDPPTDRLLSDDLNEVRYYRRLNLKVLVLNCSSGATARRTNKIGINERVALRLISQDLWKRDELISTYDSKGSFVLQYPFRVCAAHYSPCYTLSYFLTNYETLPGWDWEDTSFNRCCINILFQMFVDVLCKENMYYCADEIPAELEKARNDFLTEIKAMDSALQCLEKEENLEAQKGEKPGEDQTSRNPRDEMEDKYYNYLKTRQDDRSVVSQMRVNDLYHRFQLYKNWLEDGGRRNDEQISQLIYEAVECDRMSRDDQAVYRSFMEDELGVFKEPKEPPKSKEDKERFLYDVSDCAEKTSFKRAVSWEPARSKCDLFLAGHVHAYSDDVKKHGTLVADQFVRGQENCFRGYVIEEMQVTEKSGSVAAAMDIAKPIARFRYARLDALNGNGSSPL